MSFSFKKFKNVGYLQLCIYVERSSRQMCLTEYARLTHTLYVWMTDWDHFYNTKQAFGIWIQWKIWDGLRNTLFRGCLDSTMPYSLFIGYEFLITVLLSVPTECSFIYRLNTEFYICTTTSYPIERYQGIYKFLTRLYPVGEVQWALIAGRELRASVYASVYPVKFQMFMKRGQTKKYANNFDIACVCAWRA